MIDRFWCKTKRRSTRESAGNSLDCPQVYSCPAPSQIICTMRFMRILRSGLGAQAGHFGNLQEGVSSTRAASFNDSIDARCGEARPVLAPCRDRIDRPPYDGKRKGSDMVNNRR